MKARIVQKIGCVLVGLAAANLAAFAGNYAVGRLLRKAAGDIDVRRRDHHRQVSP